jgi:dihydroflavonol-4-reductase
MILVTGGTGLVGAQLLYDLASQGKPVRALRRATSDDSVLRLVFAGRPELLSLVKWIEGDTTDIYSVSEALDGVEEVYHCAASISYVPSGIRQMMKVNVEGTANMVNAALETGVRKFCHVSSVAALGRTEDNVLINETVFWKSSKYNSNYAISKYLGEREVWRAMEEGLDALIVQPSIIIGPGDWKTGSTAMFTELWKGMKYYSEGMMGFVDVRDVTDSMIKLMAKGRMGQRYIVSAENLTYHQVFDYIADSFGKPRPSIFVNKFLSEAGWRAEAVRSFILQRKPFITKETARNSQMRWKYANEKIKKETGMEFIPVKAAVQRTAELFMKDMQK